MGDEVVVVELAEDDFDDLIVLSKCIRKGVMYTHASMNSMMMRRSVPWNLCIQMLTWQFVMQTMMPTRM